MNFFTKGRWLPLSSIVLYSKDDPEYALKNSRERIEMHNDDLGAFLFINSNIQNTRNKNFKKSKLSLRGVPIAVKDNICVKNMPTTCGSKVLEGYIPPYNATVIARIENAGGSIIGKTNMDEFAMGSSTENSAYGLCKNPWDKERVPGGSSGGSAAAVAAGLVPVALGSDTGGSVRQPAAFCGIVGFKPSYGVVSRYGLVSYGSSLDQIGILSTRVLDTMHLFNVIKGRDTSDMTQCAFNINSKTSIKKPIVGLVKEYAEHPLIEDAVKEALSIVASAVIEIGGEVKEISLPMLDDTVIPAYYLTACAEASSNLSKYDGIRFGNRGDENTNDILSLVKGSRNLFGPEVKRRILLGTYILRAGYYEHYYGKAQQARHQIAKGLLNAFKNIDLLLMPTVPTRAFKIGEHVEDALQMKIADTFTVTANLAGLPAISLPVHTVNGLPTAIQFMAPRYYDNYLLEMSALIEKEIGFINLDYGVKNLDQKLPKGKMKK